MELITTISASLPKLIQDYLNQEGELAQCYAFQHNFDGVLAAAKSRQSQIRDYSLLSTVLQEQATSSKYATTEVFENIEKLANGAVTITTGHQLCIYGGPLFFFHKILSAIAMASRLRENGVEAVPVYWMASEDHDFDEINHIYIGDEKVSWNINASGPVGHLNLQGLESFKSKLTEAFENNPVKKDLLKKLDEIYSAEKTLAQATRDFVYWAFGELGIVVIDADEARFKHQFVPIIKSDVFDQSSSDALQKSNQRLINLGYPIQVEGREINFFYMKTGYRERIVKTESGFSTADAKFSWNKVEMESEIESNPERFSPNVVLRPVYQELILPNASYIGGPGELSYWLQLHPVFQRFGVFYPAVLLRDMVTIATEKVKKRLSQLELSFEDAKKSEDALLTDFVRRMGSHEHLVDQISEKILPFLEELQASLSTLESNLAKSAETEKKRILSRLEQLQKKTLRSDKRKAEVISKRISEIKKELYPLKTPQERIHNWLNYFNAPVQYSKEALPFYNLIEIGIKILG